MSEKKHFQKTPLTLTLHAGKKFAYCDCGHAESFPSCDGSHRTHGGKPLKFTLEETKEVTLCRCGDSADKPYCDGSHLRR